MPDDEATRFVTACVLPAVKKMHTALDGKDTPYRHVVSCLASVLHHVWGEGESLTDGSESEHPDANAIPGMSDNAGGVDLLHAFPVADVPFGCGSGCECADGSNCALNRSSGSRSRTRVRMPLVPLEAVSAGDGVPRKE